MQPPNGSNAHLIPIYRPGPEFAARIRALDGSVIVVDDGSGPDWRAFFEELSLLPHVTVLRHAVRLGDAASRTTAVNQLLCGGASPETVTVQGVEVEVRRLPALMRFPWLFGWFRLRAVMPRYAPWIVLALVVAVAAAEVYGFRAGALFAQDLWEAKGQARLIQFAGVFAALSAAVLILVPWLYGYLAAGLALAATLVLIPKAVLGVALLLFSAWCLGGLHRDGSAAQRIILGLALLVIPMPLLTRVPMHYPAVWLAILAVPILWQRPRLRMPRVTPLGSWGERAGFALLVLVMAIHWFAMLKPEAGPDGLALHLAVPADIARHHVMTYQPDRFVWAVMPMGGDFLYAIVYQFGGEQGARLLNLALLGVLVALLHGAVRRWTGPGAAWLLCALFAATPLVQLVTGELFIENLLAGLLLGAFLAIGSGALAAAAVLAGAALATKLGALPLIAFLLVYAAWQRPRMRAAVAAGTLLLAAGAPTYAIAWAKTGNPIFPFANERFHSPLLPPGGEVRDARFREPLTARTPFDLTFRSHLYFEGQNGAFGFQYLWLGPLALAGALVCRKRTVTAAALAALSGCYLVLRAEPNARYLYPELPLLYVPFAALLGWSAMRSRLLWGALLGVAGTCAALNVWFIASASYWHKDLYGPFTDAQREQYLGVTAPVRVAIAWLERTHPGTGVLLTNDTAIAGISGPVYENQWHQLNTMEAIHAAPDVPALGALLSGWKVRYVIGRRGSLQHLPRPQSLRDLLAQCATPEFAFEEFFVARLEPGCPAPGTAPPRSPEPEVFLPHGRYDDTDPALLFRGDWERSAEFAEPLNHTTSYANEAGAEMAFGFEGTEVNWIFARAPNRGIAEVWIDGVSRGTVDLYGAAPQWGQSIPIGGLAKGRHVLRIRVTGTHRAGAQGAFIDLDALEVK